MAKKQRETKKYFRILSIDGGGIRGIIPAAVLSTVERLIRNLRGDDTLNIGDCFDLVAGTSTGGILTCLYLAPDPNHPTRARFSAEDGLDLYLRNGDEIFDRSIWKFIGSLGGLADEKYPSKPLEEALERYLGDVDLKDLIKPCLVTAYSTKDFRPYFFTQHDAGESPKQNYLVREVARSTSAAPTYFEAAMPESLDDVPNAMPMIDGGVFANNPTACAFVEAVRSDKLAQGVENVVILSLGTGRSPKSIPYSECKGWGQAAWLRPLLDILMEGVSQTVDFQLRTVFESLGIGSQYLRINGSFRDAEHGLEIPGLDPSMDHASRDNMSKLERFGRRLAEIHEPELTKFVEDYFRS